MIYKNYLNDIARINKAERFENITKILDYNFINYRVQPIPGYSTFGNIIVEFNPGVDKKIVIAAHYDNYVGSPGANDNAAACSVLLNLINKFRNSDKHIEFLFFDLEEQGFKGSKYYINTNQQDILNAINIDMCGIGENTVLSTHYVNNEVNERLLEIYKKHNVTILKQLPPGDANIFIERHIPTFYIISSTNNDLLWFENFSNGIYPGENPDFMLTMHEPCDTVDKINLVQVERIYSFIYELIESLFWFNW